MAGATHTRLRAAAAAMAVLSSAAQLTLTVAPSGAYSVSVTGWPAANLASSETGIAVGGAWLSSANGGLKTAGSPTTAPGSDAWGAYTETVLDWAAASSGDSLLRTKWRVYTTTPAIVFEQVLLANVSTGGGDRNVRIPYIPPHVWEECGTGGGGGRRGL